VPEPEDEPSRTETCTHAVRSFFSRAA
jgi:hypothetical protein